MSSKAEENTLQLEMENEAEKVAIASAVSLLNDLRYLLVRVDGDVGFRLTRKEILKIGNKQEPFLKYLHSIIFQARSVWFRNAFKIWQQTNSLDGFIIKSTKNSLKVTPSIEDGKLIFSIENVSINAFQELVKFIYSTKCKLDDENINELFELSQSFDIQSLRKRIVSYYSAKLQATDDVNIILRLLKLSEENQINEIKTECLRKINKHYHTASFTKAWNEILIEKPKLISEIMENAF